MKTNRFFIAALAAMTLFASCSKEQVTTDPTGEKAKLSIIFDNPVVEGTKAYDVTTETAIKTATIIVLNGESIADKIPVTNPADITAGTTKEYDVTTAATKVIVVANADLSTSTATNLTALKKELASLETMTDNLSVNGFYASGTSSTLDWSAAGTASNGTSKKVTTTVTCKLLSAKLNVKVVNNMTNYTGTAGFMLQNVAVLYRCGIFLLGCRHRKQQ